MAIRKQVGAMAALGATIIDFGLCAPVQAAYTLTIQPSMAGVTATGAGSINFDALASFGAELDTSLIAANEGAVIVGPKTPTDDDYYSGINGPVDFGPGDELLADLGGGAIVGLGTFDQTSGGVIAVPEDYVSGASLGTSTATWTGATITSLGLTRGDYVWNWGSGATADSFTLDIISNGVPAAPEPASWALTLLGLAGLSLMRKRQKIWAPE